VFEELTEKNKEGSLENAILFFISVEKQDEIDNKIHKKCIFEIEKITTQLKVSNIVLLSFAHLFGELSSPEFGLSALKEIENLLTEKFEILRPPFGWFNELELKAKGHPLSRISRRIN